MSDQDTPSQALKNPFYRWPVWLLIVSIVLMAPVLWQLRGLKLTTEIRTLLEGDQRNLASVEKVLEILDGATVVVVSMGVDVFTSEGIDNIGKVSEAFYDTEGLTDVKSLTHSSRPVINGFKVSLEPLVPNLPSPSEAEIAELRKFCLASPLIKNVIVSPSAQHTIITATYEDRDLSTAELRRAFADEIDATLKPFRDQGVEFHVISLPIVENQILTILEANVRRFLPIAGLVSLLLLVVFLRSPVAIAVILLLQVAGLAVVPCLILLGGQSMTVFNLLLLPVIAGVQLTLLIHATGNVLRFRKQASPTPVADMLRATFRPCLFAALTTAAGLLSLQLSSLEMVRQVGLFGAMAVVLVFAITFGPGVALLRLIYERKTPTDNVPEIPIGSVLRAAPWAESKAERASIYRLPVLLAACIVLVVSAIGITFIRTDIRAVEFVKPDNPTRLAAEHFDRDFGGVNIVQIEFDSGKPNGINGKRFLDYVLSIEHFAEAQPEVSGVYSYPQLLCMMNEISSGYREGTYRLPGAFKIAGFSFALTSQNFPFLRGLCDSKMQTTQLIVRTPDMPTGQYLDVVNRIIDHAKAELPEGTEVSAKEGLHTILEAERAILRAQIQTALVTVFVIGIVLAILWRSPKLALAAILVNLIPVVLVLGLSGFSNIPLNAISVMVGAVAFGIAVDDSVHLITSFQGYLRSGHSRIDSVALALTTKSRPIILTSLILAAIFGTFLTFSFPPVMHFGLLCAVAFIAAMVTSLAVLPSLLAGRWVSSMDLEEGN